MIVALASLLVGCGNEVYEGDFLVRTQDDVEKLSSYRSVHGAIVLDGDPEVVDIAWPKLESVDRLVIRNEGQLATLDLPMLTSVGILIVESNLHLTTIRLPSLRAAGWLVVRGCGVTALDLPSLKQVDSISVANGRLETLNLPSLERIGSGAGDSPPSEISRSSVLATLRLPVLAELHDGAALMIEGNAALAAIQFPALVTLDGAMFIMDNPTLTTVDFDALTAVRNSKTIMMAGSPALVRVHAPRLERGREQLHLDLSIRSEASADSFALRGDLRQLAVASDGDAPLVVLGYARNHEAIFEGRDGLSGRLRWSTTLIGTHAGSANPVAWSSPTFVNPGTSPTFVTVHIESKPMGPDLSLGDSLLMEVVGIAPSTGKILWRERGTRSWTSDGVALLMRPREVDGRWDDAGKIVAVAGADGTMLSERVGRADFLHSRTDEPWLDGLLGFELSVDFIGNVAVWGRPGAGERPQVVAAYQLRGPDGVLAEAQRLNHGQRQPYFYRPHRAFGHGIHVVSLRRGATRASSDESEYFGGAIIDVHSRRLVWSDVDNLRLVDMTDVVREICQRPDRTDCDHLEVRKRMALSEDEE